MNRKEWLAGWDAARNRGDEAEIDRLLSVVVRDDKPPWWAWLAEIATMTGCVVVVLMVLASNQSGDELYKGAAGGLVAWLGKRLMDRGKA